MMKEHIKYLIVTRKNNKKSGIIIKMPWYLKLFSTKIEMYFIEDIKKYILAPHCLFSEEEIARFNEELKKVQQ